MRQTGRKSQSKGGNNTSLLQRTCKQCNITFQGGPRAYYCPSCRHIRQQEADKRHRDNRRAGDIRPHGSIDKCEKCGKEYTVTASLQRFCPECQKPHNLEYDKATSIEFYYGNKTRYNPIRNKRRQKDAKNCAWCGAEFKASTIADTCSPECKRLLKNKKQREYMRNKKERQNTDNERKV